MQLDPEGLSDEEHRRLEGILAFSLNLESGGDVIERNILPLGSKADEARSRTLGRGGARDRSDLPGGTEQPRRNRFNLHDGGSARSSGADRAKEEFRRREADAIRARLAQLRTSNGRQALPLDPFGVAPPLTLKLITDAQSCRRRSPAQYPGSSLPRRRQGRDNHRPSLLACRAASSASGGRPSPDR
jgi:hypothetical protein